MEEVGIDKATGKVVIEVAEEFYRPTDVVNLWGRPNEGKDTAWLEPDKDNLRGAGEDHGKT